MHHLNNIYRKITATSEISRKVSRWKRNGESVVFTNGCFDLLHTGHVEYLAKAAETGDRLVIGLNSDTSVKMLGKGELRPIKNQDTRALILAAFQFVSAVVIFEEETPIDLISTVLPDVLVKGGDWNKDEIVGADLVATNGGQVKIIPFVNGFSTTNYVDKILKSGKG